MSAGHANGRYGPSVTRSTPFKLPPPLLRPALMDLPAAMPATVGATFVDGKLQERSEPETLDRVRRCLTTEARPQHFDNCSLAG